MQKMWAVPVVNYVYMYRKYAQISRPKCKTIIKETWIYQGLKLADASASPECSIVMLNGSDIYWDFDTGERKSRRGENLVAVNSIFGWLISGLIECNKQEKDNTVTLIFIHMLKIGCYKANDEKGVNENIVNFWGLDAVGIKDNKTSIYEIFKDYV